MDYGRSMKTECVVNGVPFIVYFIAEMSGNVHVDRVNVKGDSSNLIDVLNSDVLYDLEARAQADWDDERQHILKVGLTE